MSDEDDIPIADWLKRRAAERIAQYAACRAELAEAQVRIEELEVGVAEYLGDHGPCNDAAEGCTRCAHPLCSYCELSTLLGQPGCGCDQECPAALTTPEVTPDD